MGLGHLAIDDVDVLVALDALDGIGPKAIRAICGNSRTLEEASDLARNHRTSGERHPYLTRKAAASLADLDAIERAVETSRKDRERIEILGFRTVRWDDPGYPTLLRLVDDRPPVLRISDGALRDDRLVAFAGTRDPNAFGREVSRRLAATVADAGFGIVTGGAKGVDDASQETGLDRGAPTLSVLACGIPEEGTFDHRRMTDLLERGCVVVSEFARNVPVTPSSLMTRNRTVTGMAVALCATQGSRSTGGTRKAVSDAYRQERRVFLPIPPAGHEDPERDALIEFALAHEKAHLAMRITGRQDYPAMLDVMDRERSGLTRAAMIAFDPATTSRREDRSGTGEDPGSPTQGA